MEHNKRSIILTIVFFAVLILVLCVYNIPYPISRTVQALEINMADEAHAVPREITFEGHYHANLFQDDTLTGTLLIPGYEYADGINPLSTVFLSYDGDPDHLDFDVPKGNPVRYELRMFGDLYYDAFFQHCMIAIREYTGERTSGYSTADADVIVIGAKTREEAYKIAEGLFW